MLAIPSTAIKHLYRLPILHDSARRADHALAGLVATERTARIESVQERDHDERERLLYDRVMSVSWLLGGGHMRGRVRDARTAYADALSAPPTKPKHHPNSKPPSGPSPATSTTASPMPRHPMVREGLGERGADRPG